MATRTLIGFVYLTLVSATVNGQDKLRQLLPTEESLARHGLVRRWYAFAPVDGAREAIQRITVVGDQIHLQTDASRLHVMDGMTGRVLWSAQLGPPRPGQFGSAMNSESVFAINGTYLYRLSRDDGTQLWSVRLPLSPNAAPAADDEQVIVCMRDGRVYVYHADSKQLLWYYKTNGPVSVPAIVLDGKIVCASEDGKLYVFEPSSRNPIVRPQPDAPVSAALAVWARLVIAASLDYKVYAIDVRTGQRIWRYPAGNEIRRPLAVIENEVYVTPEESGMHVLDAASGSRIWHHPRAHDFVTASRDRVYAADRYGQMLILDRASGRQFGVWDTHAFDFRVRNDVNDRLFLATKSGMVVCVHEKENTEPVIHPKAEPPGPAGEDTKRPVSKSAAAN